MATIVEDHCSTDASSEDSYEQLKELESSLYSVIHHNNLSEIEASDLPEGYNIDFNDSSNDIVVTFKDHLADYVCQSNEDVQNVTAVSDIHEEQSVNQLQCDSLNEGNSTSDLPSDPSSKTPPLLESSSDVEIIEVNIENDTIVIDNSDSDTGMIDKNIDQTNKLEDIRINITLPTRSNDSQGNVQEVIICSSSEDDVNHERISSFPNKQKRKRLKVKKNRHSLESHSPKKWTSSMVKFYNKASKKKLHFDSSRLIKKMRETLKPEDWYLSDREFLPVVSPRVRCIRCKQPGHFARDCTEPRKEIVCHMCGESGHTERRCRHSKCLTCGKSKEMYIQTCRKCNFNLLKRNYHCTLCNSNLHNQDMCPDLWRGFHLTTESSAFCVPLRSTTSQRFCSNCNKRGHLEFECSELQNSVYVIENPEVKNYFAVAQTCTTDKQFSVKMPLQDEESVLLFTDAGYDFLQNLSNTTEARLELEDDPTTLLTVFGTASQCRSVKDSVVSYLQQNVIENSPFHKHKKKSSTRKKKRITL